MNVPLVRFDPPLRFMPKTSAQKPLGLGRLSWVSFPLQRSKATRVHVFPFDGKAPSTSTEESAEYAPAGPTLPATVSLTGFLNLPATLFLSWPPYHFQIGGTHGVAPSRDLILSRSLQKLIAPEIPS
jgi:hypothetical protein